MDSKPFYKSKTFWFNLAIGLFALLEQTVTNIGITDGTLVTILATGNLLLRGLTKGAVTVS